MIRFSLLMLIFVFSAHSQYYQTLPKGVRTFVYKNVQTSNIEATFNQTNKRTPLSFEISANYEMLSQIENPLVQSVLSQLAPYSNAANLLTLGSYKIDGSSKVEVDAYGFGYGITSKLTAYAGLPVYNANVRLNYKRSSGNTYDAVAEALSETANANLAQTYGSILDQLGNKIDFDAAVLQGIATNELGFSPVGDWEGHGLGDMEFGLMYNFLTERKYGMLASGGFIAPTGRVDDPDILQDIGFGDGQWDIFAEIGGSYHLSRSLILTSYLRYTYQMASDKELRKPISQRVKYSGEKGVFNEKLGDKSLLHFSSEYLFNDWLSFTSAYEFDHQGEATYKSNDATLNRYLAYATDSHAHNLRLSAKISTVSLFQQNKFLLPASIELKAQKMLSGKNIPQIDRVELEFRMFF